jgi:hypothetical protein
LTTTKAAAESPPRQMEHRSIMQVFPTHSGKMSSFVVASVFCLFSSGCGDFPSDDSSAVTEPAEVASAEPQTQETSQSSPGGVIQAGDAAPVVPSAASSVVPAAVPAPAAPQPKAYPPAAILTKAPSDPPIPIPDYLVPTQYPATGTTLVRITDATAFGYQSRIYKHNYATRAAWNSDGSRLLLAKSHPGVLLDGRTYEFLGRFDLPGELWSNVDPDLMFGVTQNPPTFVKVKVSTGAVTPVRVFSDYSLVVIGGGKGVQTNDDRYVAMIGRRSGGVDVFVYDIANDAIVATKKFDGWTGPWGDVGTAMVSPSGKYVTVGIYRNGGAEQGTDVYDLQTMTFQRRLASGYALHADVGVDAQGHEVLLTQHATPALTSHRLSDGFVRVELPASHMAYNQHISCRNYRRPGWCYVSTGSHNTGFEAFLYRGIFALKLDGSGTIERFAPNFFAQSPVDLAYERGPWAVPNPDGTKVLFSSDWGDASSNAVIHSYVAGVQPSP